MKYKHAINKLSMIDRRKAVNSFLYSETREDCVKHDVYKYGKRMKEMEAKDL